LAGSGTRRPTGSTSTTFKRIIARALLFRATERLVSAQPWYNGGYRANIVAYTLAVLGEILKRAGKAAPYGKIWTAQAVDVPTEAAIVAIATAVNEEIIQPPQGISNISEWCKKEACWTGLLGKVDVFADLLDESFLEGLPSAGEGAADLQEARRTQKVDNGIEAQTKVLAITVKDWGRVHATLSARKVLTAKETGVLQIAMQMPMKLPTEKQCLVLLDTLEKARLEGLVFS
jgi:hypothetical protein